MVQEYMNLEETQDSLFALLEYFDGVCRENDLRYWLAYGTLLGAVRHQNFIPWDDDVDVLMPREDYEKLLSIEETALDENHFFVNYRNSQFPFSFTKLCDKRIRVYTDAYKGFAEEGLWLDIFALDSAPEDNRLLKKLWTRKNIWQLIAYSQTRNSNNIKSKIIKKIIACLTKPFISARVCMQKIDSIGSPFSRTNASRVIPFNNCSLVMEYSLWKKDWFDGSSEVTVRGRTFPGPVDPDAVLAQCYGSYMDLPPEDERVSHGIRAWRVCSGESALETF